MSKVTLFLVALLLVFVACERGPLSPPNVADADAAALLSQAGDAGLVRTTWPSPEDPGMPFYARGSIAEQVFIVDGWAVVTFYRDPACIPADFNLLDFFDVPAAFGCPHTVTGSSHWHGAPFAGAPKVIQSRGMGAVPYWFIPAEDLLAAMEDGVLTVEELAGIPGRIVGHASHFTETLHPHPNPPHLGGGGHPVPKLIQTAHGTLEDGRRFQYHVATVDGGGGTIRLRFF